MGRCTSETHKFMPPAHVSTLATPASYPRVLEVVTSPDLVRHIVCFLPNAGQVHSSKYVSRAWYGSCTLHLRSRLDINHHLSSWFSNVLGFRRLQCELELVISGSFAVSFFREADDQFVPTTGKASDMDLFIEWTSARELVWFLTAEGFTLETAFENNHTFPLADVQGPSIPDDSFERVLRYRRGDKRIDVVCTSATPVYCVFSFHCTLVMNIITWDRAYCLYPFDTLVLNRGLVLRENNDRTRLALDKYRERGFTLVPWWEGSSDWLSGALRATHRWVGDAHCWTVKLDTDGVTSFRDPASREQIDAAVPSSYIYELNGFAMEIVRAHGATMDNSTIWVARVDCVILEDESLLYSYAATATFREQVYRYLSRRLQLSGTFWNRRRLDPSRDARLLAVKEEHDRRASDPSLPAHTLYG